MKPQRSSHSGRQAAGASSSTEWMGSHPPPPCGRHLRSSVSLGVLSSIVNRKTNALRRQTACTPESPINLLSPTDKEGFVGARAGGLCVIEIVREAPRCGKLDEWSGRTGARNTNFYLRRSAAIFARLKNVPNKECQFGTAVNFRKNKIDDFLRYWGATVRLSENRERVILKLIQGCAVVMKNKDYDSGGSTLTSVIAVSIDANYITFN